MDKRKRIDEILAEITNHGIKGTATLSAYGQDKVNEAKSSLLSHILAEMPCTSSTLKLTAKEKFIWLSGVKDCVDKLKEVFGV